MEDGCFVVHTKREGTDQEVVIMFCLFRSHPIDGKREIYAYLDKHKSSVEEFDNAVQSITATSKWDSRGTFVDVLQDYIMAYCKDTLYNKSFNSAKRLLRFTTHDPVVAEYIWKVNFNTMKKRFALISDLEIAVRHQNKLLRANNIEELGRMMQQSLSVDLPPAH